MHLPPIDIRRLKRQPRRDPLEKDIEKKVCKYGKRIDIPSQKFTSPNRHSVPDRIFFLGRGLVKFIEFKRLGEKPTPGQEREHARLREMGYEVAVVDTIEQGENLLEHWLKERAGLL